MIVTTTTSAAIEEDVGVESYDVGGLRRACANAMREDAWTYRPFADGACAEDSSDGDAAWEQYVHDVEHTATWGGQLELTALAKVLRRRIEVFSATMPVVVLGEEFGSDRAALRVCYHHHAFGLGEHYNSVEVGKSA
jgi:OTU domain-containing protein 6